MKRRTTRCSLHGHREFEIDVGTLDETMTGSLVGYLERSVASGIRFEHGQSIQFGFQLLEVREDGANLTLVGPEPRTVERAVVATMRQRFVVESFGFDLSVDFPDPRSSALACRRAYAALEVTASRAAVSAERASGWVVMCADDGHDHSDPGELEWPTIAELTERVTGLRLFVAMPVGTRIAFANGGATQVSLDGTVRAPEPGSFLAALARRERWPIALATGPDRGLS
jgi:hypothetical protein